MVALFAIAAVICGAVQVILGLRKKRTITIDAIILVNRQW